MQNYKELKVWQKGHQFALDIYKVTTRYPKEEVYGLTSQLRRAALSIASNLAEGSGRNSQAEFAQYLNMSLGSANESEYCILLSKDLKYLDQDVFDSLYKQINEIKAMLIAMISKVRNKKP